MSKEGKAVFKLRVDIPNKYLTPEINYNNIFDLVVTELESHIGEKLPVEVNDDETKK